MVLSAGEEGYAHRYVLDPEVPISAGTRRYTESNCCRVSGGRDLMWERMCPNLIPFEASREAPLSVDGVACRRREGGSGEDEGGGGGIPGSDK